MTDTLSLLVLAGFIGGFLAGAIAGMWLSWRIDQAEKNEEQIWGD